MFGITKTINVEVDEECSSCHGSGAYSKNDIEACGTCHALVEPLKLTKPL